MRKLKRKIRTCVRVLSWYLSLIFRTRIKIDSREVRRHMYLFFRYKEWGYETTITKVDAYMSKNKILVVIETHRPGVLIGKAGSFIDALRNNLQERLKYDVEIRIEECKLWHKLFE